MAKRKKQAASGGSRKASKRIKGKGKKQPVTLPSLWTLPEEVRSLILSLVCSRVASSNSYANGPTLRLSRRWRLDLDVEMVCTLTLVSRDFYSYFNELLWAHIRISRPSALAELHNALVSRPSNGLLVKSLHIGPLVDLKRSFWPVRMKDEDESPFQGDEPMIFFKTGLTEQEEALRPEWCDAGHEFAYLEGHPRCDRRAAYRAARTALAWKDVLPFPLCGFVDQDYKRLGIVEWTKRLFYAQGALDLYLCKMREVEDDGGGPSLKKKAWWMEEALDDCPRGDCGHYPRLVLEGFDEVEPSTEKSSSSAPAAEAEPGKAASASPNQASSMPTSQRGENSDFIVTRDQIRAHLSRRGALTDHFDHPFLFAQPGRRYLARNIFEQVVANPANVRESEYIADGPQLDSSGLSGNGKGQDVSTAPDQAKEEDEAVPPSLSFLINLPDPLSHDQVRVHAQQVLSLTSNLKNLSLTGTFHGLLRPSKLPILDQLRYLSIGPLTPYQDAALCIEGGQTDLSTLEKLRICGHYPNTGPASLIGGVVEGLPALREACWDFGHTEADGDGGAPFLWKMVNIMRGAKETANDNASSEGRSSPCNYVELRVHPTYVEALLDMASTPETRAALADGRRASDARCPLRIKESRAAKREDPKAWYPPPQQFDVLRREGQKWWKECALELERAAGQRE